MMMMNMRMAMTIMILYKTVVSISWEIILNVLEDCDSSNVSPVVPFWIDCFG